MELFTQVSSVSRGNEAEPEPLYLQDSSGSLKGDAESTANKNFTLKIQNSVEDASQGNTSTIAQREKIFISAIKEAMKGDVAKYSQFKIARLVAGSLVLFEKFLTRCSSIAFNRTI